MKKDIAGAGTESSTPVFEILESLVREQAQAFIQQILEEEVTELLGRGKSERREDDVLLSAIPGTDVRGPSLLLEQDRDLERRVLLQLLVEESSVVQLGPFGDCLLECLDHVAVGHVTALDTDKQQRENLNQFVLPEGSQFVRVEQVFVVERALARSREGG